MLTNQLTCWSSGQTDALLVHDKNIPHEFPLIAGDVQIVPSECIINLGVVLDSGGGTTEDNFNASCQFFVRRKKFDVPSNKIKS